VVGLDRSCVIEPADWKARVERSLPDVKEFLQKAKAFERLTLNGTKRRAGFKAYAGHVLPEGDFPAIWQIEVLKVALMAMTKGHCAYCQACVEDSSYGPVEHFLPKSLFPLSAFVVWNYFFSCQRCNLAKSDKWPAIGAYVRPDKGDPAARFVFDGRGWVRAAAGDADAKLTIRDFALNRKGLRKKRRQAIQQWLKVLRPILELEELPEARRNELAARLLVPRLSRFSEAINQNVRRAWGEALPGLGL